MKTVFTGSFTQQEPIPESAIETAVEIMRSGRLHRYNLVGEDEGEVSALEREFAAYTGAKYCLAVASGGYAIATALRALGVNAGDRVLTNAFTLAPVPGAIASLGAVPVFVGVTEQLTIDLEDLRAKAKFADVLVLSHMRGHLCDMDELMKICRSMDVKVVEDCAHTMGASWNGIPSGRHGDMACYSTQTYKHINSGEGGLLTGDDPQTMARATMLTGSYMLYARHGAAPHPVEFEQIKYTTPNVSGRMDHLRAAILRPQVQDLETQCKRWNERYQTVESVLWGTPGLTVVERPEQETYVGSSIQFLLLDWSDEKVNDVIAQCLERGVEMKWFGGAEPNGFTSRYDSWRYAPSERMPASDRILKGIVDMRLPLTFSVEDCAVIAQIIREEVSTVFQAA
ncbi:MAG: aminotransferase class I/II-fold pyridoxal phosphate-dependent enzyme [Paracoccaceae bacterium]|nr:aminotransferase class I/II-fold pyridoxal phosphate-dependent enzyme [Paracoccaceae bacterium]MDG2260323.1 aminotransferase class I/II-fold pyridoxal phosphate-dependent enzyme [Paracoccaceae bacterium]